jgi:hypothetical protein
MIIEIDHPAISFNKEDSTFVAELSSLERTRFEITGLCMQATPIYVKNPATGNQIRMTRTSVDSSDSGEDIAGWWYRGFNQQNGKSFKFLFIND